MLIPFRKEKKDKIIFPRINFFKTCCNEEPWKQYHDNKCQSNFAKPNTSEVIAHAQFIMFRVLGHEKACDNFLIFNQFINYSK